MTYIEAVHGAGQPFHNQNKLKFIESLRFMAASLNTLTSLASPENKFFNVSECMKSGFRSNELFTLLYRKGVIPCERFDCCDKLVETTLPSIESFFRKLIGTNVSGEDCEQAEIITKKFKTRIIGDYSELYLGADVLPLAVFFENFKYTCLVGHGLDPAHYFGEPGFSLGTM